MPAQHPSVDALLFDFGNVIVDIDFRRAFEVWARAARVPAARIAQRFAFDQAYAAHELGELDGTHYFASLRDTLGMHLSDDEFLAGWNAIFVQPRQGMDSLLPALASSMPLYLFSNTNALHYAYWSEQYRSLMHSFTGIFCSHQIGARKPARNAFMSVAAKIGVAPSRLAFFDDLSENVEGAREAGLPAFHVISVPELRNALRTLHIPLPPGA